MRKIVVNSIEFPYNIGCRVLKTKYGNKPFEGLEDIWDDIQPLTFAEISKDITNIEQRRVAITILGIENLLKEVDAKLYKKEAIVKETSWVNSSGELVSHKFVDTYELYKVDSKELFKNVDRTWGMPTDPFYFVKFKDTSTDREYMIWVDYISVLGANGLSRWRDSEMAKFNPIQAIAWTFQTNLPVGSIEKIIRQGDCILFKTKRNTTPSVVRHLTEHEYRELLTFES
jgi:hypothetical protein